VHHSQARVAFTTSTVKLAAVTISIMLTYLFFQVHCPSQSIEGSPCARQTVQIARLAATDGRPRRWRDPASDCQQPTRTAMRGGEGALHCCRAGTGSSNARVCTGQETETCTCQEREKGQEVSADAGQPEEGETVIDGRIISCSRNWYPYTHFAILRYSRYSRYYKRVPQ
jgi:hypothetical protein